MVRAGTVLAGRYQLEQRVGSGGMGEVWRAFDRVLSRTVAVKCLLSGADEPSFVDQFRAEARIMATVSHPGVVEVYDFGDDPATGVYLVMKFIEGESLAHTLAREGRLSPAATMRLVAEAAEALHAAHERGVTHRDIKPGNLLLRPNGSALVTDFGIARSADTTGHTTTGLLIGTAGYMAPERAMGRPATPASDLYSLGVVAYRCLTGQLPFAGESLVEIAMRHVHDDPPPLPPEVPADVRAVVERAMAKDPARRWPSGEALAHAARRLSAQDQPRYRPGVATAPTRPQAVAAVPTGRRTATGRRSTRRPLVFAAVGLVVAATAVTAFVANRPAQAPPQSLTSSPSPSAEAVSPAAVDVATSAAATPSPATAVPSPGAASPKPSAATGLTAPNGLTATPISASTIRLRWKDRSGGERGFTVIDGMLSKDVGANITTLDWTGLAPASRSCFKVRAFDATGVSPYFPTAQTEWVCAVSLDGSGPTAPTDLTATAVDSGTIRLRWVDNSSDEDGFSVMDSLESRPVGANVTTFDWTGLAPGTYKCFKVRARNSAGVSPWAPAPQHEWACVTTPAT
ncbi:protein kinase [Catellatospora sp. KI3]|uniref:protein kinase domain-containing protein n=1 Tax=Catellatospora sp. KI3 TaxID=3041620 RepID=UPI002482A034|nr:protein kinase [Catellatospora sp. KI3]MDI1463993.1 protein kinase [Catellatospora sp. KI3]